MEVWTAHSLLFGRFHGLRILSSRGKWEADVLRQGDLLIRNGAEKTDEVTVSMAVVAGEWS